MYYQVQRHCNHSRCIVITFDLAQFPSHVGDKKLQAVRPLIIADAAIRYACFEFDKIPFLLILCAWPFRCGAVLYMDNTQRLTRGKLELLLSAAERGGGVVTWPTRHATSTLTHPKMFDFFHTTPENFLFVPMVLSTHMLVLDNRLVREKFLLPWVQCALISECLAPVGSQSSGCRSELHSIYNSKLLMNCCCSGLTRSPSIDTRGATGTTTLL
jgi:hypothetical protein